MAFVLNPTRKFTVKYETPTPKDLKEGETFEKDTFEADFEFVLTEDCFTDDIRKRVVALKPLLDKDSDEVKADKIYKQQALMWHKLRKSLVAVRGIDDVDGNPINIKDEKGNIVDDIQAAVFEFITNFDTVATEVLTAYLGLNPKNSKAGATK